MLYSRTSGECKLVGDNFQERGCSGLPDMARPPVLKNPGAADGGGTNFSGNALPTRRASEMRFVAGFLIFVVC